MQVWSWNFRKIIYIWFVTNPPDVKLYVPTSPVTLFSDPQSSNAQSRSLTEYMAALVLLLMLRLLLLEPLLLVLPKRIKLLVISLAAVLVCLAVLLSPPPPPPLAVAEANLLTHLQNSSSLALVIRNLHVPSND
jgi:hypothetical protein